MRSSKPKYSAAQNQELETKTFMVLAQTTEALTAAEICSRDFTLTNQTPQKMARVLNKMILVIHLMSIMKAKNVILVLICTLPKSIQQRKC